jgi:hypothetical protein
VIDDPPVVLDLRYVGGPLDGTTERRVFPPCVGDSVNRLSGVEYVKYVWDGSAFVFEE